MKKTLLILLFLIPITTFGQWKRSGGKFIPNDSSLTVKVNVLQQDTPVEALWTYVPYFVETATGAAWMGAAYNQNWYGFQVTQFIEPDSVAWYLISANASTDSFKVAIKRATDSVTICETAWGSHASTSSGQLWFQAFTSTDMLEPGKTYILMYSHNTNTTLPVIDIVNNANWYAVLARSSLSGTLSPGAWFSAFPAALTGSSALSPSKVPIFILKRTGTP